MSEFDRKSENIQKLANLPPDKLVDHLAETHQKLNESAPGIAPHVNNVAVNGINFLNGQLPKPATEFPGDENLKPSKTQQDQWLDHYDMVNNPMSVLDHVKNGTLNSQHMEALSAVHPDLLHEMQQRVMEQAQPKQMKHLEYSTKIAVSKFLGTPLHQSLMPGVIANDQAQFNLGPGQAAGTPQRRSAGLDKMSLSKRAATKTQESESE